jgi:hypothetical protein
MLDQRHHSIAGDTSAVIDDRQTAACEPIENTAFADIRTADDGNAREAHKLRFPSSSIVQGQVGASSPLFWFVTIVAWKSFLGETLLGIVAQRSDLARWGSGRG